ncbi:cytochrome P450 [Nocardia carnea]|uniref:cytochrome P450 n=1 Tax=Nocardia carnea TaxID=37328 RepID=UPI0024587544|nr:cytochrome P450 [Nocardia carnea]
MTNTHTAPETADILDYPLERDTACPFAPPPEVLGLVTERPLSRVRIWDGSTPWLVTGYAELKALMSDPRISTDDHQPGFPHWNEGMLELVNHRARSVFNTDGEEHSRFRRMMTKPFTVKRVDALRPAIQEITDDHIDAILAGPQPADLVEALALPVPSLVISEMLGVPYEDHEFFQEHATTGVSRFATKEESAKGRAGLARYLIDLIKSKMENPAEDMVTELAERVTAGEISMKEAAQIGTGVLIAGHETSANMIALGTLALLEHPGQLALLRDTDDPKVVANAVEELLRYLSIIQNGQRRVAVEDIEIGGHTIKAGEGVIIDLAPANWDPNQFPEPDKLDLTRSARLHVGFGFGPHQCVGQQLARVELQIVFKTLLRRMPGLRLAIPFDEVEFKHDKLAFGVYRLPVTW